MRSIKELEMRASELADQLAPLVREQSEVHAELRKSRSMEFIRVNGITRAQVWASGATNIPWMGDVWTFGAWIKKQPDYYLRPWTEWNTGLYLTSDIVNGIMRETPARFEDVEA